jgi:hypothetical protein
MARVLVCLGCGQAMRPRAGLRVCSTAAGLGRGESALSPLADHTCLK